MPIWSSDGNVYENEALAILGIPNKSSLPSSQDGPIIDVADSPAQRSRWWQEWRKSDNVVDRRTDPFDDSLRSLDELIQKYDEQQTATIDENSRKELRKKMDEALNELRKYSPKKDPWEGLRMMDNRERRMGSVGRLPEGSGGGVTAPARVQDILTNYAQGKIGAKEVHKQMKDTGWSVNLRVKNSYELTDPSGKVIYESF